MKKLIFIFSILYFLITISDLKAQNENYQTLINKKDKLIKNTSLYGSLLHQHQDFFNKAFSYQGIEGGIIINHKLFIGAYGSAFISNLKAEIVYGSMDVFAWHCGLSIGRIYNETTLLHSGWQLKTGYFSLSGKYSDYRIFSPAASDITIGGMIIEPEIFAELNVSTWMKFRTGIAYAFYSFENQSVITKTDLQNISVNFGFVFGKFN